MINKLELRAIYFSLLALCKFYHNCHICVKSDSATAVAYINRIGGSVLSLLEETKNIWNWCFCKNIFISAVHIPGKNNKIPVYLSREFNDCTEWMINADVFKTLCRFFKPKIDLFAWIHKYLIIMYLMYHVLCIRSKCSWIWCIFFICNLMLLNVVYIKSCRADRISSVLDHMLRLANHIIAAACL